MNQSAGTQRHIHRILPFLLFTVFALCIMAVLCSGAHSYRTLTARDQASYHRRTCVQYLSTRIRQATNSDAISLTRFGDGDALAITQNVEGQPYTTLVYCCDGWLRELFTDDISSCTPQSGEPVIELTALTTQWEGSLLLLEITDLQGETTQIALAPRGGKGNLL